MNRPFSYALSLLLALGTLPLEMSFSSASGLRFVPSPPPSAGAPAGRPRGGASRGNCPDVGKPLTALVPFGPLPANPQTDNQLPQEWVWAKTVTPRPTFWFYVPYRLNGKILVTFALQDDKDNNLYRADLMPTSEPGVVQISLPANAPALEPGKRYQWFFTIECEPNLSLETRGWVDRINADPDFTQKLTQATPRDRASLYASNGLWYEALTTLADLRRRNPNDGAIAADWSSLLQSVGVDPAVAAVPLVNCCQPGLEPR
jgi:hypothetical protein